LLHPLLAYWRSLLGREDGRRDFEASRVRAGEESPDYLYVENFMELFGEAELV
jgi:hypothetical protein